jgi:NitT/TauT family transport system permease protein
LLVLFAFAAMQMSRPFAVGETLQISLDPSYLPYYLLRTILRMFTALAFSLVFSLIFAAIAVKYAAAEKVMIPALDIL